MKVAAPRKTHAPVQLTWISLGTLYRVTAWPDASFERQCDGTWVPFDPDPSSEVFACAAVMLGRAEWTRYLEFLPSDARDFIQTFSLGRMAALAIVTRCPELVPVLSETPGLTAFVAAHTLLRGGGRPVWNEVGATFERGGVYGLLEWLGLPAQRQTLDTLVQMEDPEIPISRLSTVRTALWLPEPIRSITLCGLLSRKESRAGHALQATRRAA